MPSVWKNISVPVRRDVMCIIDQFFKEAPPGKSPQTKQNVFSLVYLFSLRNTQDQDIPYGSKETF